MEIVPPTRKCNIDKAKKFRKPKMIKLTDFVYPTIKEDFQSICGIAVSPSASYPVNIKLEESADREFYSIEIKYTGVEIRASDNANSAYAILTLIQIISQWQDEWHYTSVEDFPAYKTRAFMIDMGRSIFPVELIKRIIRIMFRLKMNTLHLHLFDDELCGIRFDEFDFGQENPHSITIAELKEIIDYAKKYYVDIIPEIEAWAHVGSIGYYVPKLIGGAGVYNGAAFIICNQTFELISRLAEQLVEIMPADSILHFGLDEANWYLGDDLPESFTPADMVNRYYDILSELNVKYGKQIKFALWADHKEKKLPANLINRKDFIVEPWQYWIANSDDIDRKLREYKDLGVSLLAGAGQSMAQFRGSYFATRYWSQKGEKCDNLIGIDTTMWGWNDIENKFVTLFAGGYFSWFPNSESPLATTDDSENFDRVVFPIMSNFVSIFREDIDFDKLREERIETVFNGYYLTGKARYKPVAFTVPLANTAGGHNFIAET